jgi:hypothetical protein
MAGEHPLVSQKPNTLAARIPVITVLVRNIWGKGEKED